MSVRLFNMVKDGIIGGMHMKLGFQRFDDISWRYMLAYKRRTIFTILSITLAVILFFGAGTIYTSLNRAYFNRNRNLYGDYDVSGQINPEEYQRMKRLDYVDEIVLEDMNYDYFTGVDEYTHIITIIYLNTFNQNLLHFDLLEGRYPQNSYEILLSKTAAEYRGLKTGDTIELGYYEYWYKGSYIGNRREEALEYIREYQKSADNQGTGENKITLDDFDKKIITQVYTLTGIYDEGYEDPSAYSDFISFMDMEQNPTHLTALVKFRNHINYSSKLLQEENIYMTENKKVTDYRYGYKGNHSELDNLLKYIIAVIAFTIVFWIAVAVIRNSFVMSMAERSRDYGILRCMGISQGRLRRILMKEGLAMAGISCILGMGITVLAIQAGKYLKGVRMILRQWHIYDTFHVYVAPWVVAGSIVIIICAVLFSLLEPARQIGAMAPISAILERKSIKKESIKRRKTHVIRWLFGTEGDYAYKNLMRNPGKFIASVIGVSVSVVGIIVSGQLIHISRGMVNDVEGLSIYDAECVLVSGEGKTERDIEAMKQALLELKSVKSVNELYSVLIEKDDKNGLPVNRDEENPENVNYQAIGIDEEQLEDLKPLLEEGNLDYAALQSGGAILCRKQRMLHEMAGEWSVSEVTNSNLQVGDTLWLKNHTIACPIVAVIEYAPECENILPVVYFAREYYQSKVIDKELEAGGFSSIQIQCSKEYNTEEIIKFNKEHISWKFSDDGKHEQQDAMKAYVQLMIVITLIITAIGGCNILNTLISNITLRKKEIQIMHSVGMSYRQILKMLGLEGSLSSIFGSALGILLGLFIGYELSRFAGEVKYGIKYSLPWEGILISIGVVVIITIISMVIAKKELKPEEE